MAGKNFIIQGEKLQITLLSLLYLYVDIAATKRSPNMIKLNWPMNGTKKGKPGCQHYLQQDPKEICEYAARAGA